MFLGGFVGGNLGSISLAYATGNVTRRHERRRWRFRRLQRRQLNQTYARGAVTAATALSRRIRRGQFRRAGRRKRDPASGSITQSYALGPVTGRQRSGGGRIRGAQSRHARPDLRGRPRLAGTAARQAGSSPPTTASRRSATTTLVHVEDHLRIHATGVATNSYWDRRPPDASTSAGGTGLDTIGLAVADCRRGSTRRSGRIQPYPSYPHFGWQPQRPGPDDGDLLTCRLLPTADAVAAHQQPSVNPPTRRRQHRRRHLSLATGGNGRRRSRRRRRRPASSNPASLHAARSTSSAATETRSSRTRWWCRSSSRSSTRRSSKHALQPLRLTLARLAEPCDHGTLALPVPHHRRPDRARRHPLARGSRRSSRSAQPNYLYRWRTDGRAARAAPASKAMPRNTCCRSCTSPTSTAWRAPTYRSR